MATDARISVVLILQLLGYCIPSSAVFPDFGSIQSSASTLSRELNELLNMGTHYHQLEQAYLNESASMTFTSVDGAAIAESMASDLGKILAKKMKALRKSVTWAEEVAANYTWVPNLEIEDVEYLNTKRMNMSDPNIQYSAQFKQLVSFANSSVHIPVEIYEGDNSILNGLAWTNQLDEIWASNREEDPTLLWQYFGSQTGIMRTFPANEWQGSDPDLYDVRRRPWYTQGASSPKDMLILVDTSGSSHGKGNIMMKYAAMSLLDTLGEDDFVNVASFAENAEFVVPCFNTFVQANYWNKKVLNSFVSNLKAKGMGSYTTSLEFAFQQFETFATSENRTEGQGADCNRVIMFLTDGGTEMPEEVFKKYNWPEKRIRIFSYAVGPTANPIAAVRWIACVNRGYFYRIPAMGAIRSTVQEHVEVVARPLALSQADYLMWSNIYRDALSAYSSALSYGLVGNQSQEMMWTSIYPDSLDYVHVLARPRAMADDKEFTWTNVKLDPMGLGMMTTVTLPVYNRSLDANNQTILGVMGGDVTVQEMESYIPTRKLGPNGYVFAINSNGYIVFHPNLKATMGLVTNPPNVDILDVEYSDVAKEELRRKMIDQETDYETITTYVYLPDERHIDNKTRTFHFHGIPNSTFSLAVVTTDYARYYVESMTEIPREIGIDWLTTEISSVLLAPWDFCSNMGSVPAGNSTPMEDFVTKLTTDYQDCDDSMIQILFHDAKVTAQMVDFWKRVIDSNDDFNGFFIGTNGGMTRVYPAHANESLANYADVWHSVYYRRAFDNDALWMYSAPYRAEEGNYNDSVPEVMVTKAITIPKYNYKPAVMGALMNQEGLRRMMFDNVPQCREQFASSVCYLVDDGGFVMVSSDVEDEYKVGMFFGAPAVEPILMSKLVNDSVFIQNIQYDYQAACVQIIQKISAGPRSVVMPFFLEMLTLKWWTSKVAWAYLNFNIYQWLFPESPSYTMAQEAEEAENYICVKQMGQYTFNPGEGAEHKEEVNCGNCTRIFATSRLRQTNLLLVMVERDCAGTCVDRPLLQAPEEVVDPNFVDADTGPGHCTLSHRYRRRPDCYDYNPYENNEECSTAPGRLGLSLASTAAALLLATLLCHQGAPLS